jgi:hypothetical protein
MTTAKASFPDIGVSEVRTREEILFAMSEEEYLSNDPACTKLALVIQDGEIMSSRILISFLLRREVRKENFIIKICY